MEDIYFLAGLGTEKNDVSVFKESLSKLGFNLRYIDLPGQHSQRENQIISAQDFSAWIQKEIPRGSKMLAFSLGADLAVSFIETIEPSHLVLLDGAILTLTDFKSNLEIEMNSTALFIEENELNMNPATVQNLLRIREEQRRNIFETTSKTAMLLLICDSYPEIFELKKERIQENRNSNLHAEIVSHSTHQIFVDQPESVAKAVQRFLRQASHVHLKR